MAHDWTALLWDESGVLADLFEQVDDAGFDHATLCAGWRTRDVAGHVLIGHTTPMPKMLALLTKYRFNVPKGSFELSKAYGSEHTPAELRTQWRAVAQQHTRKGITKMISSKEGFTDHLIHGQDIRRPLGLKRELPPEHAIAALDALPTIGGFLASKKRMAGLSWKATDLEWSWGSGPLVSGTAEALILAAAGRTVVLPELTGDGVAELTKRIS